MLAESSLFMLAVVGMGLLKLTFSRTQQEAFVLNFFLLNPFFILSGFTFPLPTPNESVDRLGYTQKFRMDASTVAVVRPAP